MNYTQDNSSLRIETPLGRDALLITRLTGVESISHPFSFDLSLISGNKAIDPDKIIGKGLCISIDLPDRACRYINGIVTWFSQSGDATEHGRLPMASYQAIVVPSFWLLSLTGNCRIFQNLSIPDIASKVLGEHAIPYESRLTEDYPPWEYCVQYMESDFNFVSRLLEEEGIAYFFENTKDEHRMILADSIDAYRPRPHQAQARYGLNAGAVLEDDTIHALQWNKQLRPAKYSVQDYNFLTPANNLTATIPTLKKIGPGEREIYGYSTGHDDWEEGDRLARMRMEEEEAQILHMKGESDCRAFMSGYRFMLTGYFRNDMDNKEYLITSVKHEAYQSFGGEGETGYSNSFTCIPHVTKFRPQRTITKPLMPGSQTAFVVGPKGQEIYTDPHGRVKVQFHWDREGAMDENSSCWVRISQPTAGKGWGSISLPRIGHEVIVDFLEGDPDRPFITGSAYHEHNTPPYALPDHKTRSTIKSHSTTGGGGFNELRLEDMKGNEEIFIHAQKDQNIVIKNRRGETVGSDSGTVIGKNKDEFVGADSYSQVKGTQTQIADEIILSAYKKITLVVGSSSIVMTPDEIRINSGPKVYINDGSSAAMPPVKEVSGALSHGGGPGKPGKPLSAAKPPAKPPAAAPAVPGKSAAAPVKADVPAQANALEAKSDISSDTSAAPPADVAAEEDPWKIGPVTDNPSSGSPSPSSSPLSGTGERLASSMPGTIANAAQTGDVKGAMKDAALGEGNRMVGETGNKLLEKTGMSSQDASTASRITQEGLTYWKKS